MVAPKASQSVTVHLAWDETTNACVGHFAAHLPSRKAWRETPPGGTPSPSSVLLALPYQ